jgi:hypothetical protein
VEGKLIERETGIELGRDRNILCSGALASTYVFQRIRFNQILSCSNTMEDNLSILNNFKTRAKSD